MLSIEDYVSPILYIRDAKGKARHWAVWTEGEDIIVEWGTVEGKSTQKRTTAKPKNTGKSNATTAQEQAVVEAKAKYKKQVDLEDYHPDIQQSGLQFRPTLALDYLKVSHRVDWDQAIAQPKLNGVRIASGYRTAKSSELELMTRKGLTFDIPSFVEPSKHLSHAINQYLPADKTCQILDGEAYVHGWTFQKINSATKKYRPATTDLLEFHIFDLYIPGYTFSERMEILNEAHYVAAEKGLIDRDMFKLVETLVLEGEEHLNLALGTYMQQGYEGIMIRHENSEYSRSQRGPDLFKYKSFLEAEYKIIGMWEDNNNNAMLRCVTAEGGMFDCTPKRTHAERKAMLLAPDDYIGKWITVKYQELTEVGLPAFPIGLELRDCNDRGEPQR